MAEHLPEKHVQRQSHPLLDPFDRLFAGENLKSGSMLWLWVCFKIFLNQRLQQDSEEVFFIKKFANFLQSMHDTHKEDEILRNIVRTALLLFTREQNPQDLPVFYGVNSRNMIFATFQTIHEKAHAINTVKPSFPIKNLISLINYSTGIMFTTLLKNRNVVGYHTEHYTNFLDIFITQQIKTQLNYFTEDNKELVKIALLFNFIQYLDITLKRPPAAAAPVSGNSVFHADGISAHLAQERQKLA